MANEFIRQEANNDFNKARSRETIQKILNLLNPSRHEMLSLREVREALRPKSESYRGLQVVPLDRIVRSRMTSAANDSCFHFSAVVSQSRS